MRDDREFSMRLINPQQAHDAFTRGWTHAKAMLLAGNRMQLSVRPETRSSAQNRLLHSRLQDVARQVRVFETDDGPVFRVPDTGETGGRPVPLGVMKRLMTAAWLREHGARPQLFPAIDGAGVDVIYEPTHQMTRAQLSELSEYVLAFGDDQGVRWSPPSLPGFEA